MSKPLVSCIMPAKPEHARFVQAALHGYAAQTYEECGLLLRLQTGKEAITLGSLRNEMVYTSAGSIIAHLDCDDFYAPEYIERVVRMFHLFPEAQVIASNTALFYDARDQSVWRYTGRGSQIIGATLAYRRSWWEYHRFPAQSVGEDQKFALAALQARALHIVDVEGLFVARTHEHNTCPRVYCDSEGRPNREWSRATIADLPAGFREVEGI